MDGMIASISNALPDMVCHWDSIQQPHPDIGQQQAMPGLPDPASGRDPGDIVRDAFRRRAEHAMEHITRSASIEALGEALSAPTDFGAVARALGDPTAFTASRTWTRWRTHGHGAQQSGNACR